MDIIPNYKKQSGDVFGRDKFPKYMTPQLPNMCVTAIMEYLLKIFGSNTTQGDIGTYYLQKYNEFVPFSGVSLANIVALVNHYFTTGTFISFQDSINGGCFVMTCVVINDVNRNPTGHNVLVVGYHPDGTLIVMEPETGRLKEFDEDWFSNMYNIPITGIN